MRNQRYDRGTDRGMRPMGYVGSRYDVRMYGYEAGPRGGERPRRPGDGGDFWWIGEHETQGRRYRDSYDGAFRPGAERYRPHFSPVGGMHPAMGGYSAAGHIPRPLRDYRHFSDWTRWF